jgi:hypothetical protein
MIAIKLAFLGLCLATLSACGSGAEGVRLADARNTWTEAGINSYRYTLTIGCFCPPGLRGPVEIEVIDGRTIDVRFSAGAADVNREYFDRYDTIEDLFAVIEEALAQSPDSAGIGYDNRYGFPHSISFDFEQEVADDEISYTVENFELLEAGE